MKKIIVLLVLFTAMSATALLAKGRTLELRLVVSEEKSKTIPCSKYSFAAHEGEKSQEICVGKETFLSGKDIQAIKIIRKADRVRGKYPLMNILFNVQGAEELKTITKSNIGGQIAVLVDGELIETPTVIYPLAKGFIQISSWKFDTDDKLEALAKDLGVAPSFVPSAAKKK